MRVKEKFSIPKRYVIPRKILPPGGCTVLIQTLDTAGVENDPRQKVNLFIYYWITTISIIGYITRPKKHRYNAWNVIVSIVLAELHAVQVWRLPSLFSNAGFFWFWHSLTSSRITRPETWAQHLEFDCNPVGPIPIQVNINEFKFWRPLSWIFHFRLGSTQLLLVSLNT